MNQEDRQYYIRYRDTGEKIPVTKEEFTAFYHDIDVYRIRQQRRGHCFCPRNRQYLCNMDCFTCPFHKEECSASVNYCLTGDDGCIGEWIDVIPDEAPLTEELVIQAAEAKELLQRVCDLIPEALEIGRLRMTGIPDTKIQHLIGIADSTFQGNIKRAKKILQKEFPDFFENL